MCYRPLHIKNEVGIYHSVPCGRCSECKRARVNVMRLRALGEAYTTKDKNGFCFFVTLTYNDENLPTIDGTPCFSRKHITNFFKKLRHYLTDNEKNGACVRYIQCSEYGSKFGRPHYHCLFYVTGIGYYDFNFKDIVTRAWSHGFVDVQMCKDIVKSSNYVSKYISKNYALLSSEDKPFVSGDKLEKFFNIDLEAPQSDVSSIDWVTSDGEIVKPKADTILSLNTTTKLKGLSVTDYEDGEREYKVSRDTSDLTTYNFHRTSLGLGEEWILAHTDDSVLKCGKIAICGTDSKGQQKVFNYSLGPYLYRKLTHDKVTCKDTFPLLNDNNKYYTRYSQCFFITAHGYEVACAKIEKQCHTMTQKIEHWCGQNFNSPVYGSICKNHDYVKLFNTLIRNLSPSVYIIPSNFTVPLDLQPFVFQNSRFGNNNLVSVNRLSTNILNRDGLIDYVQHSYFYDCENNFFPDSEHIIGVYLGRPEQIGIIARTELAEQKQIENDKLELRQNNTTLWYE